ncbi:MAG TPA: Glu/Leu/Phe/Val dehydrogenase [Jiangellaceae bacterium]|nr:Glu/Leu/Phe/Val dehydrogenase [Jiangellaceae bacterium]
MSEVTAWWPVDELGPEKVIFTRLPADCLGIVVVDNVALGPAIGGLRMTPSVDAAEVARLARAMTIKNAACGLPHGGAKAGIVVPGELDETNRERVIRAFAGAIRELTEYIPGPDMGTDETAMAWIRDEIGRAVGLPSALGGIPLDVLGATGYGLAVCAETLSEAGLLDLNGARVVVQGFGAVGLNAALRLAERGAVVVAVSDSRGAIHDPAGLDVEAVAVFKRTDRNSVGDFPGALGVPRDDILALDCDVLVPAAQPDVITKQNADLVRVKVVLPGANIPVTVEAEQMLHKRGVLCVPDVIANAGGVICAAVEYRGGDWDAALATIRSRIRASTLGLVDRFRSRDLEPRAAAEEMALERVTAAQSYRRRY